MSDSNLLETTHICGLYKVDKVLDDVLLEHDPAMLKDNAVFIGEVHDTTGGIINYVKCHNIYG